MILVPKIGPHGFVSPPDTALVTQVIDIEALADKAQVVRGFRKNPPVHLRHSTRVTRRDNKCSHA
jgi:hypothetical protein